MRLFIRVEALERGCCETARTRAQSEWAAAGIAKPDQGSDEHLPVVMASESGAALMARRLIYMIEFGHG